MIIQSRKNASREGGHGVYIRKPSLIGGKGTCLNPKPNLYTIRPRWDFRGTAPDKRANSKLTNGTTQIKQAHDKHLTSHKMPPKPLPAGHSPTRCACSFCYFVQKTQSGLLSEEVLHEDVMRVTSEGEQNSPHLFLVPTPRLQVRGPERARGNEMRWLQVRGAPHWRITQWPETRQNRPFRAWPLPRVGSDRICGACLAPRRAVGLFCQMVW